MLDIKSKISAFKWPLFLAGVLIALRIPALIHPVLDVDEAIYGLFSRVWFDGGVPYVDCVETKPLGIYFFYGAIFSIFGRFNMIAVHAVTIAVVGGTAYVIYLIANSLYDRRAGFWAALFYIVFSTTYIPKYIATTIEPVMLLSVALQFWLWIRFEREGRGWWAFGSGLAFGISCLFKYQAGMNLIILMAYLGIAKPILAHERPEIEHWRGFARFIAGSLLPPLLMIAYLYRAGALDGFWFWNIRGSLEYVREGSASIGLVHQLLTRVMPYIASTALIWVLAIYGTIALYRNTRHETRDFAHEWLIVLWLILSFVPVSAGHRFYGHYFLLLVPPMSILAAPVAARIWADKSQKWSRRAILKWIILPAVGFTVARFFIPQINRAAGEDNLDDYRPIAAYVASQTAPADRVVAWGYAPLIYWYSERLPATRFFWSDALTGRVPGLKGGIPSETAAYVNPVAWEMFMEDIRRHRPAYIIDTSPSGLHDYQYYPILAYSRLMEYIEGHYRGETTISGAVFYRRRD
ncbi:MAG: glycosyltransferase family 39 protein [Pseudomonadota bacterium]